ncbi:unnamed protein product, partial [marine sediment metagenome]
NIIFVTKNNINDFNVFDLDDYGSPSNTTLKV